MTISAQDLEKDAIAEILRSFDKPRRVELNDVATCLDGPFAHQLLHVRAFQRRRGIAMVTVGPWPGIEEVLISDLYHFMDYFHAVMESMGHQRRKLH